MKVTVMGTGDVGVSNAILFAQHPATYYHADLICECTVAADILEGFKGYLHCDGYPGYKNIPNVKLVGCRAHVRRKFFKIPGNNGKAEKVVGYCD